ncbi:hypothetical protein RQP46_002016 [Phenoliferia psychrophenolica]
MSALFTRAYEQVIWVKDVALDRYKGLPRSGKVAVWVYFALHIVIGAAVWWITPTKLLEQMAEWGKGLSEMRYGWALLLTCIIATSFPPMFGYGTCITLCGFAFGVLRGWLLGTLGCILGSVTRRLIGVFAPMLGRDKTFRALATAVRVKGLPLVVLIRLCPFPFPYSNAFFASIESVSLWQFFVATLTITPKLLLHVWVGSRMFLFADPDSRKHMDTQTKVINGVYVVVGSILGGFTSWYLYKLTMKYVDEVNLQEDEGEDLEEQAGLIDSVDAMLDEDDDATPLSPLSSSGTTPRASVSPALSTSSNLRSAPSPVAPARALAPTPNPKVAAVKATETPYRDSVESVRKSGRPSEDWEGAFSDFDDGEGEEEEEKHEDDDPLGLGLTSSSQASGPDKRRD